MKRWMILAAAAALALPVAQAQLYKYVDKNGKTVYSDSPPPDTDSKQIRVQTSPPSDAPASKTSVQKDKDADKGRKEAAKKADKDAKDAERQAKIQERCNYLKSDLATYEGGVRLKRTNEKGEQEFMTDEQIEAAKAKTRAAMEEACSQK
ncbi:MAG TPA: DUF4124 domain-containing protein [Usitatibacter sp.]|jgi:hypothetical protein|nr:DUF4124 domain-containing protein [Usitatibacter sp.]